MDLRLHSLLFLALLMPSCSAIPQNEGAGSLPSRRIPAGAGSRLKRVDLLVSGDGNCDPARRPESFSVVLDGSRPIEGVSSATVLKPSGFLLKPFSPSAEETEFLKKLKGDPQRLKDAAQLAEYQALAERLFSAALAPPFPTRARASRFGGSVVFVHSLGLGDLLEFQRWYFEDVATKTNPDFQVTTTGNPDEPLLPLILYGTVRKSGDPQKSVVFDSADSIITGNPQNEAHDTTLCQLRKGIFNLDREPKADITIVRIKSVEAP